MQEVSKTAEMLRHQFGHGEPAGPMRHAARDALQRSAGVDPDPVWIDDVLIVISELVQNVTQHTRSHGELIISVNLAAVLVEVGDTSTTVPRPCSPDPLRAGGRGLWLIEAVCQQWGVRTCTGGKVVWALIRKPSEQLAQAAVTTATPRPEEIRRSV